MAKNKRFPPFLRAFYNLTCQNDDSEDTVNEDLKKHLRDACDRVRLMKEKESEQRKTLKKQEIGKTLSTHGMNEDIIKAELECNLQTTTETIHSIVQTTDNFMINAGWSVLSLFYHPGICEVTVQNKDQKSFAFWPTCAPKVNNRSVDYGMLYNEQTNGFVQAFVNDSKISWEGQAVRVLPYCVTLDVALSEVKLGPVIGTTNNLSQQSPEVNDSVDESDCFAGNLRAIQIIFAEVQKLLHVLTDEGEEEHEEVSTSTTILDHEKALIGLRKAILVLTDSEKFNGLKTPKDWCTLYMKLWHNHKGDVGFDDFPFHPKSLTDLVHKTRLLFLSKHTIRFAFLEGQKRTTAATYGLTGFIPRDKFSFHGDQDTKLSIIGGDRNFFNNQNKYSDENEMTKSEDTCLQTFKNGAKTVTVNVYQFNTVKHELNLNVIRCCRALSKVLVQEGNREQVRSWKNIVESLSTKNEIQNALAGSIHLQAWINYSEINDYVKMYREAFFGQIYEDEQRALHVREDCKEIPVLLEILNGTEGKQDFIDHCLYTQKSILKADGKKALRVKIYGSYVDFRNTPAPKMLHYLATIFGCVGIGLGGGLTTISTVSQLQGQRSSIFAYKDGFTFFEPEKNFIVKVSFFYRKSVTVNRFPTTNPKT
jgi:hypothetical protein